MSHKVFGNLDCDICDICDKMKMSQHYKIVGKGERLVTFVTKTTYSGLSQLSHAHSPMFCISFVSLV
jgi:hypothetical protein